MYLKTPYVLGVDHSPAGNQLQQIANPGARIEGALAPFTGGKVQGWLFQAANGGETILIVPPKTKLAKVPDHHLRVMAAGVSDGKAGARADSAQVP